MPIDDVSGSESFSTGDEFVTPEPLPYGRIETKDARVLPVYGHVLH
jgi:hypothetical protein